jgi:hypothetical protein
LGLEDHPGHDASSRLAWRSDMSRKKEKKGGAGGRKCKYVAQRESQVAGKYIIITTMPWSNVKLERR